MIIRFHKFQGTGNDFIMIDDREQDFPDQDLELVRTLCERRFGIGADGLILIRNHPELDFDMIYYNADGTQSLCGNGSRCSVLFARMLGCCGEETHFNSIEGPLYAFIKENLVHLHMPDVMENKQMGDDWYIHSGSPHYIRYVTNVEEMDVYSEGRKIRYSGMFGERGVNVNFVEKTGNSSIFVRTYERGVENETLSCGTGVTACALAYSLLGNSSPVEVNTRGGKLQVSFRKEQNHFTEIYLTGPAEKVYEGRIFI